MRDRRAGGPRSCLECEVCEAVSEQVSEVAAGEGREGRKTSEFGSHMAYGGGFGRASEAPEGVSAEPSSKAASRGDFFGGGGGRRQGAGHPLPEGDAGQRLGKEGQP